MKFLFPLHIFTTNNTIAVFLMAGIIFIIRYNPLGILIDSLILKGLQRNKKTYVILKFEFNVIFNVVSAIKNNQLTTKNAYHKITKDLSFILFNIESSLTVAQEYRKQLA